MRGSFFSFFSLALLAAVIVGGIYSRHGFLDLRRIQKQIAQTKVRVTTLEVENQKLKYQTNLFENPSEDLIEREVRDFLGWVKPNELVYLESVPFKTLPN